jgi:hypothetical protein
MAMALRRRAVAAAAGLLAIAVTTAAPAHAAAPGTPRETGCPAGQLLSVTMLESQGPYQAPRRLDTAGNNDGFVCGHPLNQEAAERTVCGGPCPVPVIYLFRDNTLAGYVPAT